VGREEGLPEAGVITCDNIVTVPKGYLDFRRVGHLGVQKRIELDAALRFALDVQY